MNWITSFLDELAETISEGMKKINAKGKTITLKVRYKNFDTVTRSQSVPNYTNDHHQISTVARQLLEDTEVGTRQVRLLGISLSNLNLSEEHYYEQLKLEFKRGLLMGDD